MKTRIFFSYVELDQESADRLSQYAEVHSIQSPNPEESKRNAEAILCLTLPPEEIKKLNRLKLIQALTAGVDGLPWKEIPPEVIVCGNMGSNADAVAEHTWAIILSIAKRIHHYFANVRQGDFRRNSELLQLSGKTLAIIGMGAVGTRVAEIGKSFNMHVIGVTRSGKPKSPADQVFDPSKLRQVFSASDFIVISTPLTKHTREMIDLSLLRLLKKGSVVVNVGRAELVRRTDLLQFLTERPDVSFATDVWWEARRDGPWETELVKLPNFFGTPWVAGAFGSREVYRKMLTAAVDNIIRYFKGETPLNIIDRSEYV
ncbi:MAG: 2-hydroxyacid dehydrogenase [Candidatus Caldarchaeum sp.]|nr:2-hydroxyacid dehydrogenase [Candidatus Caldarchaeum sp.]